MSPPLKNTPLILIVRDGWGENPHPEHDSFNAVKLARTPIAHMLDRDWPRTLIHTSGEDVGLPDGTMGNSEVGHQNIGAGRIVDQESVAITKACRLGLEHNAVLAEGVKRAIQHKAAVHLLCICSDAGVHGQLNHLFACVRLCKTLGATNVFLHLMMDGRDTGPFTGIEYVRQVETQLAEIGLGRIASLVGRYWIMDRDFRWERVERAYRCITALGKPGEFPVFPSAAAAVQAYYDKPDGPADGDEFITPRLVGTPDQIRASRIADNDTLIFVNYRGDRPREISSAFVYPDDKWAAVKASPDSGKRGFPRGPKLNLHYITMTAYSEDLAPFVHVAFPKPPKMVNIMGDYLSKLGITQFRCAETEKYPHVTFFFNDYRDEPFPGEHRENPQSPKVATYDLKPEMSADQVCDAVLRRLAAPDCEQFIVVNFANADMVGHTGSLPAAIKACETVDACVGAIIDAALKRGGGSGGGGSLIITADHGNSEQMFDPKTNSPHTSHTLYDVPLYVVGQAFKGKKLRAGGRLADISPTALAMMGLPKPPEMTGESLLVS